MAKLNLYTNVTPNSDYVHYFFTAFNSYKTALGSHMLVQYDFNTYRINAGTVSVKLNSTLTLSNYKQVTYIINEYDNVCYYVDDATTQSDYIIYTIRVDYWATYLVQSQITNLHVTRCNRNIGTGVYDDIEVSGTLAYTDFPMTATDRNSSYTNYYDLSKLYIVYAVTFNVYEANYKAINSSRLFCNNIKDIYDKCVLADPNLAQTNALDLAVSVISGISTVVSTGILNNLDAEVTRAWILPYELITLISPAASGIEFNSRSYYITSQFRVKPLELIAGTFERTFTLSIDPDYEYFVGTFLNGLEIKRTTTTASVTYKSYIDNYGVELVVKQGSHEKDISNLFEVELTLNSGDFTQLSSIKNVLKTFTTELSAIATMNPVTAVSGLIGAFNPMLSNVGTGKQVGDGDGMLTWRKTGNPANYCCAKFGYGYSTAKSVDNEKLKARTRGAKFDEYTALTSVFTASLLGTGTETNTYIEASCNVSNVPLIAQDVIKTKLASGIYIQVIQ